MKKLRLVAIAAICLLAHPLPLQALATPQEAARAAIRDLDLQAAMPDGTIKPPPRGGDLSGLLLNSEAARGLLWGTVIVGGLVLAYYLRDSLPLFDRSRRIVAREDGLGLVPHTSAMQEAQMEADELAGLGRFVEAMHVLLLQSVAEMRRRLGISISDSLTSREILSRVELPGQGRASLGAIIQQVERTYFGAQGADRLDYTTCRQNFDVLKQTLSARPAG